MVYSDKFRVVYIAPPKTGTRSIVNILKDYNFDKESNIEHLEKVPDKLKKYYTFITIRNPYDRAVSLWWFHFKREQRKPIFDYFNFIKETDGTLEKFLQWLINNKGQKEKGYRFTLTQADYLKNNRIDKVVYMEELEKDFNSLPFIKTSVTLPTINRAIDLKVNPKTKSSFDYIEQKELDLINEYYKEDFEMLPKYKIVNIIK